MQKVAKLYSTRLFIFPEAKFANFTLQKIGSSKSNETTYIEIK